MKEVTRDSILGIVFFGAIGILIYFTIVLTDFSFTQKPKLSIRFTQAQGLKVGDPVLVLGTRTGRVVDIYFDSQVQGPYRVLATIQLDKRVTLKQGFQIRIEESSFLGGRMITIDPGSADKPIVDEKSELLGLVESSPLAELGELVHENREDLKKIISSFRTVSEKIEKGEGTLGKLVHESALYDNTLAMINDAKTITKDLRDGKGTLGRFLVDDTLSNNIASTVTNFGDLAKGLKDGKGTLGKLLTEDSLFNSLNEVASDIRAGKGVIGKLVYDENLAGDFSSIAKNLRSISDELLHGKGTLAQLLHDSSLYDNLNSTAGDLKILIADMREGKGTLGRLFRDDALYQDIQNTFRNLNRTLEDAREAAPIATFAGLLFVAF